MRAVALTVRAAGAEAALDRLLPAAPGGVYERRSGPAVELVLPEDGGPLAGRDALAADAGAALLDAAERTLPDDPRARVAQLMPPPVVAGRFVVRPPWAPPPEDAALLDLVIERDGAFGTALHPTTRRCLELLTALEPGGPLADLGCGTGVLAIAAARLGWTPVTALDRDAASAAVAERNAAANGAGAIVTAAQRDLLAEPPPAARTLLANVPPHVHAAILNGSSDAPEQAILSGIGPAEADRVAAGYAERGLVERRRHVDGDWAALLLTRPDAPLRAAPPDGPRAERPRPKLRIPASVLRPAAGREGGGPRAAPRELPAQVASTLPDGTVALSSARPLPEGARVAVLLAPSLFRLDVRHLEDTLQFSIRNLSGRPIRFLEDPSRRGLVPVGGGDGLATLRATHTGARVPLRVGDRTATLLFSALSDATSPGGRIVAQATLRPA